MSTAPICPCCGASMDGRPDPRTLWPFIFSTMTIQGRLAEKLANRFGECVPHDALIEAGWAGDAKGGPDNPDVTLKAHIHYLRVALRTFNIAITGGGRAYRMHWSS